MKLVRSELRARVQTYLGEQARCAIAIHAQKHALRVPLVIARGCQTYSDIFTVVVRTKRSYGRGEFVPSRSLGESAEQLSAMAGKIRRLGNLGDLLDFIDEMDAGSLSAAVDCALWDLVSKSSGRRVWSLVGMPQPKERALVRSISVGEPSQMAATASGFCANTTIKLKLSGIGDAERVRAVRSALPNARIIVDANGSWDVQMYLASIAWMLEYGVEMIEQPLSPADDHALSELPRPITLCADESFFAVAQLERIAKIYGVVNIKLAKLGGFSAAMSAVNLSGKSGLRLMLGCSVSTSLSIAPLMVLSHRAAYLDLDGPMFLRSDRHGSLISNGRLTTPRRALWG